MNLFLLRNTQKIGGYATLVTYFKSSKGFIVSKSAIRLLFMLAVVFFMLSMPFIQYPLTDGDIKNWADSAAILAQNNQFLGNLNDQAHGPLITWGSALFLKISPYSFYMLNFFNLIMGILGCYLMYFFSLKIWKSENLARFNMYLLSTSLMFVYLSRTPMYDWPATVFYFGFCGFYLLYLESQKKSYFWISVVMAAIGSLSRFSICLGLMGILMIFSHFIYKRSIWDSLKDCVLGTSVVALINLPWFISQADSNGIGFVKSFIYDNTGRFVKSTRKNATYRGDFYGFSLYVLVGLIPHTFVMITSFFNRHFSGILKKERIYQFLLASFLPCLILFSASGHTKLGRYIAYVFPSLIMLMGHYVFTEGLDNAEFRAKAAKMTGFTAIFFGILLTVYWFQFSKEASQSVVFVSAIALLLFSLLLISYLSVAKFWQSLKEYSDRWLLAHALIYVVFFSVLAFEIPKTPFLAHVRDSIMARLNGSVIE